MSRLFDGAHPWGSYEATVSRYGVRRYSLIIYPPGASTTDRWLARLWRGWPITGAALLLLGVVMSDSAVASPGTVLTAAASAYLGISMLLFFRAGSLRARSLSIILMPNTADVQELRRYTEWRTLVDMLIKADRMLTIRAISPVEHEAIWWDAYERLEAIQLA
ncbi:hypothetical protein MMAN_53950 [Mycobacterium mantenii]|uniref:Uncharacterized protein n=1 Tax=Mycobacterium mantenii TaxID=560555 RepID=A0A1X0FHI1_MYCNT|nr:DUF6611 family protein [Mycobacterium mantenii]MCV7245812.1 hypothetical protein [Mycobacterium mantenii]ORB01203.1 hypothetical protein BST30_21845 [Mycobacterium mantenii]BBY41261.1 hypothetical protein MMAN_53950 [Mycobacterium mantenii]